MNKIFNFMLAVIMCVSCLMLPGNQVVFAGGETAVSIDKEDLKKYELDPYCIKTSFKTRIGYFKSDLKKYYSRINGKNILVVGREEFLESFKEITENGRGGGIPTQNLWIK